MPLRRLRLTNAHTGETFDGPFRDDIGPIKEAMSELSVFLRDHHSGETIGIDVGVLDFLASVMDAGGALDAARRRRLVAAIRLFSSRQRGGAHLDAGWASAGFLAPLSRPDSREV
jgi:uncharacterized protein YcbK (DUF882 family)